MKTITALFGLTLTALASATLSSQEPLALRKSSSWAGTTLYYLQGLSFPEQDRYLKTLADYGVKVVRVWVTDQTQGKCVKGNIISNGCAAFEDTIGNYNTYTLDLLDATIVKIAKNGMKALISPHNANLLSSEHDYKPDVYGRTWGSGDMYTSPDAARAYDNRLSAILNHKGSHSGQVWKDWHEAIMGIDIENEPMLLDEKWKLNDPTGWICARASHMRSILGANNPIKIASGGVGGSYGNGANFAPWVTSCPTLDIVSVHYYFDTGFGDANFVGQGKGKLVHIEEFTTHQGTGQAAEYTANAMAINNLGVPWCLWQFLPVQTCLDVGDTDDSGFVLNPDENIAGPIKAANLRTAAQDWTGIIW